jgi:uncharacterized membrane protein
MITHRGVRILALLLMVSVALNLFLGGDLLGLRFRGPPPVPTFDQRLEAAWRNLPAADQPFARKVVQEHREQVITRWLALRPAAQRVTEAIRAKPYKAEDMQAAFDNSNARTEDLRKALQETVMEIASQISEEGRQELHVPGGP